MPQISKGGKFVFGKSLVRDDMRIRLPSQAIFEYSLTSEGKVYLISGSKRSGGFVVTRKGLLYPSRIGNILSDTPELSEYRLEQGLFVGYKGRLYCWVPISGDGVVGLTDSMLQTLRISVGTELLAIRGSDIALCMAAKGPLWERADHYEGQIKVY